MYTYESGSPAQPAVVFLHGGGLSSKMWQPVIDRLPGLHCLAPDMPEHGQSRSIAPFTLDDTALRVAELIRLRVPGRRAHIVGLSLGGAVALTLSRLAPDVVASSFVTGTAAGLSNFLGGLSLASLWMLKLYKPETLARSSAKQWGIPAEYLPLFHDDLIHSTSIEFNKALLDSLMTMQLPAEITHPLLTTVGSQETIPAKQAARKLLTLYPQQATGRIIPSRGHVWALQDAQLFADTVDAWVHARTLPASLLPLT